MKSKSKILYFTILALSIIICFWNFSSKGYKSTASNVQTTNSKVEIESISKKQDVSILKINYHLSKEDPILHIYSPQFNNIDTKELEKEFNEKDIGRDDEARQIHLNLKNDIDDKGNGSFNLKIHHNSQTLLTISDVNNEKLLSKTINEVKEDVSDQENPSVPKSESQANPSDDTEITEDSPIINEKGNSKFPAPEYVHVNTYLPNWNENWEEYFNLMVTPGKQTENPDGSKTAPVIYFGAINYALTGTSPHDSTGGRPAAMANGLGRKNNITAANTGVIHIAKNSTLNEPQKSQKNKNQWHTNTFGDGLYPDKIRYRGSQRNFITTNIFDYNHHSGNVDRPTIYGPDYEEKDEWGIDEENVHFYSRLTKFSGKLLNEQRMVFYQVNHNIRIQVTITQRFDKNNAVLVTTEFKNVSPVYLDNFTGYTFRDITFTKGVKYKTNTWQANKLRSLGNLRGLYASREALNGRIEFHLKGFEDEPYAWAARGTRSTTYESKVGTDSFPWNINGLFGKYDDAFKNISDTGDKYVNNPAGETWLDPEKSIDSGISMHTKNQPLAPQQQVSMTYGVNMKVKNMKPHLDVYNGGLSRNDPYIMKPEEDFYTFHGNWYHYGEKSVNVKYRVKYINTEADDQEDPTEMLKQSKDSATGGFVEQTEEDKKLGKLQPFSKKIPIDDIGPGLYKISALAIDDKGQISNVENRYVTVPSREDQEPAITVTKPVDDTTTSEKHPYLVHLEKNKPATFDLSGIYFTDNNEVEVLYKLDNQEYQTLEVKNEGKGRHNWELKNLDLNKIKNSNEVHTIHFKIVAGTKIGYANFHFKIDQTDSFGIDAPDTIDFGKHNLAPNSELKIKPNLSDKLYLYDYRDKNANPLKVNLTVTNFAKKKQRQFSPAVDNEILNTDLFWNGKKINDTSQYTFDKIDDNTQFDLSNELQKNLELQINSDEEVEQGTFKSHWLWEARDTI